MKSNHGSFYELKVVQRSKHGSINELKVDPLFFTVHKSLTFPTTGNFIIMPEDFLPAFTANVFCS